MTPQQFQDFAKENSQKPLVLSYVDERGGCPVFAGRFTLEQLCFLKEVINRKIDSMLAPAINMGVNIKQPDKKKQNPGDKETLDLPLK